jgi:hypothetical protein
MREYISFMIAVCWTLLAALIIFGLFSWRGYNIMISERFKWDCYWQEVKEDNHIRRIMEREAKEAAEAEKREAMHAARSERKDK